MFIEKVHGLQATSITLNERFTMLATATPDRFAMRQKQRFSDQTIGSFLNQSLNIRNRYLIEQIARQFQQQSKRKSLRRRLGVPPGALRRFGSETSLPGLQRSNSFGNLSQSSVKSRVSWRQNNNNPRRASSFGNVSQAEWGGRPLRGFRRRGGGDRALRGRFRGGRGGNSRVTRVTQRPRRLQGGRGGQARGGQARGGQPGTQPRRGRGRGGAPGTQSGRPVPSRQELDEQLERYMASTKAALDRDLDQYMKDAADHE